MTIEWVTTLAQVRSPPLRQSHLRAIVSEKMLPAPSHFACQWLDDGPSLLRDLRLRAGGGGVRYVQSGDAVVGWMGRWGSTPIQPSTGREIVLRESAGRHPPLSTVKIGPPDFPPSACCTPRPWLEALSYISGAAQGCWPRISKGRRLAVVMPSFVRGTGLPQGRSPAGQWETPTDGTVRRYTPAAEPAGSSHRPEAPAVQGRTQRAYQTAPSGRMRAVRVNGERRSSPHPRTSRPER